MSAELPGEGRRFKVRIEGLSDLVFGLALALGSITLIQHIPTDPTDLTSDILTFGFSFLIIVGVWLSYSRIMGVLKVESSGALWLNVSLLFCVALEPFLYYVFSTAASGPFVDFASGAFALDTGTMMGLLACMMYLIVRQESRVGAGADQRNLRGLRITLYTQAGGSALFLLSSLSPFWVVVPIPEVGYLRFLLWYAALGLFFIGRLVIRTGGRTTAQPSPD